MSTTVINAGDKLACEERFLNWIRNHGIEPNVTYKVEITDDTMTVHQYLLNEKSAKYVKDDGDIAVKAPFTIKLKSKPPVGEGRS